MKQNRSWRFALTQTLIVLPIALALLCVHRVHAGNEPFHLATDWSHRHMVFSAPKTLMDRFRLSAEPRYVQQWVRRNAETREEEREEKERERRRWHHAEENPIHRDWNVYLGNVGIVGAGQYPAKYSFDTTTASCANDFVVWNTSLAGSSTAVAATITGTFSNRPVPPSTITITNGATTLVMTANNNGANGAGTFYRGANTTDAATNLAAAINGFGNGTSVGVSATSSGATVTLTATTAGAAGNSITIAGSVAGGGGGQNSNFSTPFATDPNPANFLDGASGVPNIVAYNNLYPTTCTGTVPSTYWAYNTGGTATTSVALSFDGKQVAFVQTVSGAAQLVLLKWLSGSGVTTPVTLTSQATASAYRSCTAPCMYAIPFSGGLNDTNSSPYYDFAHDTIYVGDNPATRGSTHAFLHKFTGVFAGTPAEVVTAGVWPATLGFEIATSPAYDQTNNQVYIADANTAGSSTGGFLYRVDAAAGTVISSARLASGVGFADGPVVDPVNGTVYLYSSLGGTTGTCNLLTGNNFVYQMPAAFAGGATAAAGTSASLGTCSTTIPTYAGDFDNAYLSGGAGHVYVCGNIGGNPTLYQVNITSAGALSTVNTGPALTTAGTTCSPVSEFENTSSSTDWIFLSVQGSAVTAAPISCPAASGCLMSFNVTSGAAINALTTATTARISVSGGASGVVADNSLSGTGESEVYFTPLSTTAGACTTTASPGVGGCAIQATQSALN